MNWLFSNAEEPRFITSMGVPLNRSSLLSQLLALKSAALKQMFWVGTPDSRAQCQSSFLLSIFPPNLVDIRIGIVHSSSQKLSDSF